MNRVEHILPDNSIAVVESISHRSSIISRFVQGKCVWGQVFAKHNEEEHAKQVELILAEMHFGPHHFVRPEHWDWARSGVL